MRLTFLTRFAATFLLVFAAHAQDPTLGSANKDLSTATVERMTSNLGVVLKHGEVKNMDLGPGSTEFRAVDIALFQRLRIGQVITFRAEKLNGRYVIVLAEPK